MGRKLCITIAALAMSFGVVGIAAPAEAMKDTSWGCGGLCFAGPGSGG